MRIADVLEKQVAYGEWLKSFLASCHTTTQLAVTQDSSSYLLCFYLCATAPLNICSSMWDRMHGIDTI